MTLSEKEGEKVIWMGDSSGANIILCSVMENLRREAEETIKTGEDEERIPRPVSVMAISPSTDLTRSNTDIQKIAPHDPFMTPAIIKDTAKAWLGDDIDATNPIVSPLFGDFGLLKKSGIRIHGVTAGYDVLSPDGVVFRERLEENGVEGNWLHWEKQMHCFVLTAPYRLREGREGLEWVVDVLKRDLDTHP